MLFKELFCNYMYKVLHRNRDFKKALFTNDLFCNIMLIVLKIKRSSDRLSIFIQEIIRLTYGTRVVDILEIIYSTEETINSATSRS